MSTQILIRIEGVKMILELTENEATMLMLHLKEEAYQVRELSDLEDGIDKENLLEEANMMSDISERIKNQL